MEITLRTAEQFHSKHLVLGTAGLGGVWSEVDLDKSVEALRYALANGVGVLDTAPSYADAQEVVGKALKGMSKSDLPIISTKTGRLRGETADDANYNFTWKSMEKSVQDSLTIMGIEVIDILFLHDPIGLPENEREGAIENMLRLKEKGYAKEIGLGGNYENPIYKDYLNKDYFTVFQGYNRFNALTLEAAEDEFAHCTENDIMIYAASPLFMGLLGRKLNDYIANRREWISEKTLAKAIKFNEMVKEWGMEIADAAHSFLYSCAELDRTVIGASKPYQVENSLEVWKRGPMDKEIFDQIVAFAKSDV